ncbi:NB-ARC domain-containing protein [Streptomyces sp. NPDC046915]|uniref:NB-ARC domain-containing protein n=1 Tax=Streptomyces sp. NPDC046915 TaxID=3155257 RepID=UPI0033DF99AE
MTETPNPETLAAALVDAREALGLTQEGLAERSGLSVRAIRNLETAHTARPRTQSLLLLARALGLPPARLLRSPRPCGPAGPVPAELPAAPRHRLAGREGLITSLKGRLCGEDGRGTSGPAVVVGPPGAGKTSLILRAAHGVRSRFPDGQVFVDLSPASSLPFTSDTLVRRVLRSLGAASTADSAEEAAARLRDALSRRRVLVVLDNVDSEAQVRPLLVDEARSAVLVAARRELPALPGQLRHQVGALAQPDAHRVLEDLVGIARTRAERSAALSILRSCAGLPLALHIAGLWLTARPHRSLRDLADRLADERARVPFLRVGDLSLRASVTAYHRLLPPPLKESLRRLQPVRGDFGVDDMLARVTPSPDLAVDLLEDLLHRQMIHVAEAGRDGGVRYRLHDAVRLYVAHCAAQRRPLGTGT